MLGAVAVLLLLVAVAVAPDVSLVSKPDKSKAAHVEQADRGAPTPTAAAPTEAAPEDAGTTPRDVLRTAMTLGAVLVGLWLLWIFGGPLLFFLGGLLLYGARCLAEAAREGKGEGSQMGRTLHEGVQHRQEAPGARPAQEVENGIYGASSRAWSKRTRGRRSAPSC